jgi:hypothetical protein
MSDSKHLIAAVPDEWRALVGLKKTIIGWPDWPPATTFRSGPKVKTSKIDLHTTSTEETEVRFLLADKNGVGLEGARLRLSAWAFKRQRDVTATLEVVGGRSFVTISRVDAWPTTPHQNSHKALKKPGLKGYSGEIPGCHVHRFDDNVKYGPEAFGAGAEGNLPVAVAFPNNLQSFRDFLRSVGTEFNIEGLDEFPAPPGWQGLV